MVAAAGAGVTTIQHELLGAQPRQPRLFVEFAGETVSPSQLLSGCTLTSMTPGSGVTESGAAAHPQAPDSPPAPPPEKDLQRLPRWR